MGASAVSIAIGVDVLVYPPQPFDQHVGTQEHAAPLSIQVRTSSGDRILVVADNCTDDTARVAAAAGAEVIERKEPGRRGKGYALQFGVAHLGRDPPEIVVFFDADCNLAYGDRSVSMDLRDNTTPSAGPQSDEGADWFLDQPPGRRIRLVCQELGPCPLGLSRLGLPCQLLGTGMAVPFGLVHSVDLASGSIVEDLKLGLDLALAGSAPMFCPSALVISEFASSAHRYDFGGAKIDCGSPGAGQPGATGTRA
jgi:hypothetical protein